MKQIIFFTFLLAVPSLLQSQETREYRVNVVSDADTNALVAHGTFRLIGNHFVGGVITRYCLSTVTINAGAHGPPIFDISGCCCSADSDNGYGGEFFLTSSQISALDAGDWYVVAGQARGKIAFDRSCDFSATNQVEFGSFIIGRNPTNGLPRFVRFGRASFGLTGNVLSYRLRMPSAFGPYQVTIADGTGTPRHPVFQQWLGTALCSEETGLPPIAPADFELLPACEVRGSICVPQELLGNVLEGSWVVFLYAPGLRLENIWITPIDSDRDGVPDFRDACSDTPAGSVIDAHGCSIEQLAPCAGPWRNHADYVNRVKQVAADFLNSGLITEAQRRTIVTRAAQSNCGK